MMLTAGASAACKAFVSIEGEDFVKDQAIISVLSLQVERAAYEKALHESAPSVDATRLADCRAAHSAASHQVCPSSQHLIVESWGTLCLSNQPHGVLSFGLAPTVSLNCRRRICGSTSTPLGPFWSFLGTRRSIGRWSGGSSPGTSVSLATSSSLGTERHQQSKAFPHCRTQISDQKRRFSSSVDPQASALLVVLFFLWRHSHDPVFTYVALVLEHTAILAIVSQGPFPHFG